MQKLVLIAVLAAVGACGSVNKDNPDAMTGTDAGLDAAPDLDAAVPTGTVREPMAAGGRLSGGGLVLDVELGHTFAQHATTGGGLTLEGGAAVKP